MPSLRLTTFHDLALHLLDFLGGATEEVNLRHARRAVLAGYREVAHSRNWAYYYKPGYLSTVASYDTGTITYTNSTRALTLASGAWPSWAASGVVLLNQQPYDVASRTSGSEIILSVNNNPGADIAAGTAYTLYQDVYPVAGDVARIGTLTNLSGNLGCFYQDPDGWLSMHRVVRGPGLPTSYTIMPSPKFFGLLAFHFYPPPASVYRFSYIYQRKPRDLSIDLYNTGTVTAASASTTLTGSGTNWTSNMVGSVIRLGSGNTDDDVPTDPSGSNPAVVERTITAWASATAVTIDAVPGQDLTTVRYTISDPVDIEEGAMLTYTFRECERQLRIIKRLQSNNDEEKQHAEARMLAWEADSRTFERLGYANRGIRMIHFPFDYTEGPFH